MSVAQLALVVSLVFQMHGLSPEYGVCTVENESRWDLEARGNNGELGLWQWKDFSIQWALDDMGIDWDWDERGDPRLCPFASTVLAAHTMNSGYRTWWSVDRLCKEAW